MKTILSFLLFGISYTAFSQIVIFNEDFESGTLNQFSVGNTLNTLTWQTTTNRGSDPGHSSSNSAYFGDASTFNYNTGNQEYASITSNPIDVSTVTNMLLEFNYFLATQGANAYDIAFVQISKNGTDFYTVADNGSQGGLMHNTNSWNTLKLDLSQYAGNVMGSYNLYIRFVFNTFDANNNNYEGFYVDDVKITSFTPDYYSLIKSDLNYKDNVVKSVKTQDGNVVIAIQQTQISGLYSESSRFQKINPVDGSVIWTSLMGTSFINLPEAVSNLNVTDFIELNNGNLFYAGKCKINASTNAKTPMYGIVNANGTTHTNMNVFRTSTDQTIDGSFNSLTQINNNNIVLVGKVWDATDVSGPGDVWGANNGPSYQPMITMTDQNGTVLWSKTLRLYNMRSSEFSKVVATNDGGFLVMGNANPNIYNYQESYLIKFNATGNIVWRKNYNTTSDRYDEIVYNTSDGTAKIFSTVPNSGEVYVYNLTASGQLNLQRVIGSPQSSLGKRIISATTTSDGGMVMTGYAIHSSKDTCLFTLKFDNNFIYEWDKTFGGDNADIGTGIQEISGNNYFVNGTSSSFSSNNASKSYLLKLDSLGNGKACFVHLPINVSNTNNSISFVDYTDSTIYVTNSYLPTIHPNSNITQNTFDDYVVNYPNVSNDNNLLSCFNDVGMVTLNVSSNSLIGGPAPYSYFWSNGSNSSLLSNVPAGSYSFEVADANGCMVKDSVILPQPLPISLNVDVINPLCNGGSDGGIDLSAFGGIGTHTYHWTNTVTTEDLTNINAGFYQVTVLDANSCSSTISTSVVEPTVLNTSVTSTSNVSCNGLCDGTISTSTTGGTAPYTYLWNDSQSQTTANANNLCPNTYLLTTTDGNNCTAYANAIITEPDAIQYNFTTTGSECGLDNGTAQIQTNGGVSPFTFNWSTGDVGSSVSNLAAGNYSVTGQDANGCSHNGNFIIDPLTQGVQICIITVDSSSQHNFVVWEKPVSNTIAGFKIYRNVAGAYNEVGYVPYANLSQFKDNTFGVNPNTTSYRYKISVVDTCGYESDLSQYHETIHVTSSVGLGGEVNLIWDNYEGFNFVNYQILKDTTDNGIDDFYEADVVSQISFTWTDQNPQDFVVYVIEIIPPTTCTSTKAQTWNSSRSNKTSKTQSVNGLAQNDIDEASLVIYPNPNSGQFNVAYNSINTVPLTYEIYDYTGRLILSNTVNSLLGDNLLNIDMNEVSNGVYTIRIMSGTSLITKQFVVQY